MYRYFTSTSIFERSILIFNKYLSISIFEKKYFCLGLARDTLVPGILKANMKRNFGINREDANEIKGLF